MKLSQLRVNDIIVMPYGMESVTARVCEVAGRNLKWHSLEWREPSGIWWTPEMFFDQVNIFSKTKSIVVSGRWRPWWKRLMLLKFNPIEGFESEAQQITLEEIEEECYE